MLGFINNTKTPKDVLPYHCKMVCPQNEHVLAILSAMAPPDPDKRQRRKRKSSYLLTPRLEKSSKKKLLIERTTEPKKSSLTAHVRLLEIYRNPWY